MSPLAWALLVAFVLVVLLVDLLVVHREAQVIPFREAAVSSAIYIAIGLAFGLVVWAYVGGRASAVYYGGFVLEKTLSIDNVFVWAVIFGYFGTPAEYQHRVLFWGVFGALVLRAIFIFAGAALLENLDWMVFVFGTVLVFTGIQLARHRGEHVIDLDRSRVMRLVRRTLPTTERYEGPRFFRAGERPPGRHPSVPRARRRRADRRDLRHRLRAGDPGLTTNTYIVFAANAFALLGLRALYFLLAGLKDRFVYLDIGLAVLLVYVGAKMYYQGFTDDKIPIGMSLPIIATVIGVAILASWLRTRGRRAEPPPGVQA